MKVSSSVRKRLYALSCIGLEWLPLTAAVKNIKRSQTSRQSQSYDCRIVSIDQQQTETRTHLDPPSFRFGGQVGKG